MRNKILLASSFTKHYKSVKPSDKEELQPKGGTDGREDKRIFFSKLSPFFCKDIALDLL